MFATSIYAFIYTISIGRQHRNAIISIFAFLSGQLILNAYPARMSIGIALLIAIFTFIRVHLFHFKGVDKRKQVE